MKFFTIAGVALALLLCSATAASANHWPSPFEFLNGTAPGLPEDCQFVTRLSDQTRPCELYFDDSERLAYVIDRINGVVATLQRFQIEDRQGRIFFTLIEITFYPRGGEPVVIRKTPSSQR